MCFGEILRGDAIAFRIFHQPHKFADLLDRKIEVPASADERQPREVVFRVAPLAASAAAAAAGQCSRSSGSSARCSRSALRAFRSSKLAPPPSGISKIVLEPQVT